MFPEYNWEELRQQPHWSFSSLNQILNICSQQYAFRKVEQLEQEFVSVDLIFGKAFHKALTYFYDALKEGEVLHQSTVGIYFEAQFLTALGLSTVKVAMSEEKDQQFYGELGKKMLELVVNERDPEDKVIGTDVAIKVDIPGSKPLICEYDLLVENKGNIIIVDNKTSAAKWAVNKAHTDLQATAYLYAFRKAVQEEVLFRYDVYTKTKSPTLTRHYTDRSLQDFNRLLKLIKIADRIVENNLYYPSETFYCGSCPYTEACMSWSQAA